MTTLMKASNQWSNRAPDERFPSIEAMHEKAMANYRQSSTGRSLVKDLRAKVVDKRLVLTGQEQTVADMTHWSFGQLANKAKAPADYLRSLPVELAAENLNHGLSTFEGDDKARLLFTKNGGLTLRAMTSPRYTRIWNADITARLVALKEQGPWQEAPAAFDGSRGQYLSDRDMFSFFVDNNRRIFETKNGGLSRGFFVWNSEVGASVFGIMTFLYEYVCGNHRVWGASNVKQVNIRHVGDADYRAFQDIKVELIEYSEKSASDDEAKIKRAVKFEIGKDKDEVLDAIFNLRLITHKVAEEAYLLAEQRVDWYGSPRSAWGFAGGLTEIARDKPNADERVKLETAATKVMEMAF